MENRLGRNRACEVTFAVTANQIGFSLFLIYLELFISMQKSQMALNEHNRAAAAALNAEVRRIKGRLMDEIPKLRKLAQKKVSPEEGDPIHDLFL